MNANMIILMDIADYSTTIAIYCRSFVGINFRVGTADNDINALRNMGMLPEGYTVNHLTDSDAFSLKQTLQMALSTLSVLQ